MGTDPNQTENTHKAPAPSAGEVWRDALLIMLSHNNVMDLPQHQHEQAVRLLCEQADKFADAYAAKFGT